MSMCAGFVTATQGAAAGGLTTMIDMPLNNVPSTTTGDLLRYKLAAAEVQPAAFLPKALCSIQAIAILLAGPACLAAASLFILAACDCLR